MAVAVVRCPLAAEGEDRPHLGDGNVVVAEGLLVRKDAHQVRLGGLPLPQMRNRPLDDLVRAAQLATRGDAGAHGISFGIQDVGVRVWWVRLPRRFPASAVNQPKLVLVAVPLQKHVEMFSGVVRVPRVIKALVPVQVYITATDP